MNSKENRCWIAFTHWVSSRYRADGTLAVAHGGVATPWNRSTIPRRYALPCTTASAPSTLPNCGF
ncbi:MAG: hypothetical protein KZQ58_10820 [gamma proteobacterium symbiont of Bathyaustriella thionipta]|nr:hypothetical protein [gamma proteobacterium symbiont of Bathyaustriella thionipta]